MADTKESPKQKYTVGDACLALLGQQYVEQCMKLTERGPLPRAADELGFAVLHLVHSGAVQAKEEALAVITLCRGAAERHGSGVWADRLGWDLCEDILEKRTGALNTLVERFNTHSSQLRIYCLELGWMVRHSLEIESVYLDLLSNVAETLVGWELCAGLCAAICWDEAQFFSLAEEHRDGLPFFEDQYDLRMAALKERGLAMCFRHFYELDIRVALEIQYAALSLPYPFPGK